MVQRAHSRIANVGVSRHQVVEVGEAIFGPHLGRAAVVANAGPRTISVPGGAIAFTSAGDLATKIAANSAGSDFVAANNIDWDQLVNASAAKAPRIWVPNNLGMNGGGRDIVGLVLDGNSELHGGIWTNFGATDNAAPLNITGATGTKLVQDATFHSNFNRGLTSFGNNSHVDHCLFYNNGRYGWAANGNPNFGVVLGFQITNCEWYGNNTRNLGMDGDAGGNKVTAHAAIYAASNWGHDNHGSGLWTDFASGSHIFEENVFEGNHRWGIFYEVGGGFVADGRSATATIRYNLLLNNVTLDDGTWFNSVELLASCCDGQQNGGTGFEFHHNLIDTTHRALGFEDHNFHPFDVKSFWAHDNDVWLRTTASGRVGGNLDTGGTNPQGDPFSAAFNNRFTANHYHVPAANLGSAYWRWAGSDRTWAQWQAVGKDTTGTLEAI